MDGELSKRLDTTEQGREQQRSDDRASVDEQSIFMQLLECDSESERQQVMREACGDNQVLRQRLQLLLEKFADATDFMESQAFAESADAMHKLFRQLVGSETPVSNVRLPSPAPRGVSLSHGAAAFAKSQHQFQLHAELARGGMGVVYEGRDQELGREVAVKVLRQSASGDADLAERFLAEAQICGQLQHPGIVPVYSAGTLDDRRPFFAMKLVRGDTLAQRLIRQTRGQENLSDTIQIFEQVCQTVAYAHSRCVIHRDLKPSNVMVGAFGEVQVMDWGLAKVLARGGNADEAVASRIHNPDARPVTSLRTSEGDTDRGNETIHGSVMGTCAYMPPEQAAGRVDELDERCDVFALGSILCEILTGKPPYVSADKDDLHRLACEADQADCHARLAASDTPAELVSLATDCLQPDADLRPADAGEVAGRLADYRQQTQQRLRQAELDSVAAATQAAEEQRRRKLAAVTFTLLLFLLLVSSVSAFSFFRSARQQRELTQTAEAHLTQSQVARLAAESRSIAEEDPVLAGLLAAHAMEQARELDGDFAVAQAALINVMRYLDDMGVPIRIDTDPVEDLFFAGRYMFAYSAKAKQLQYWPYLQPGDLVAKQQRVGGSAEPIDNYAVSDDGRRAVTISHGHMQVWGLNDRGPAVILQTDSAVEQLQLSGDGRWLVTVEPTKTETRAVDATRLVTSDSISTAASNPVRELRLWDLQQPQSLGQLVIEVEKTCHSLQLSHDGKWLAYQCEEPGEDEKTIITVIDLQTQGAQPRRLTLAGKKTKFYLCKQRPNLATVCEGGFGCRVETWDLLADASEESGGLGKPLRTTTLGSFGPRLLVSDEQYLAGIRSSLYFGRVPLFPGLPVDDSLASIIGGTQSNSTSADGRYSLCGSCTGSAVQVDHQTGESIRYPTYSLGLVKSAIDPTGCWMATTQRSGPIHLRYIGDVSPDGTNSRAAAAPNTTGQAAIHRQSRDALVWRGESGPSYTQVAVSHSGRWIATIDVRERVRLIDVERGERLLEGGSRKLAISSDERWLMTCDLRGKSPEKRRSALRPIYVWDLHATDVAASRRQCGVGMATFTPDSTQLVTSGCGKEIQVWDLSSSESCEPSEAIAGDLVELRSMVVDPTGRWLLTSGYTQEPPSRDGALATLMVRDMANLAEPARVLSRNVCFSWRLEFAADGSSLATPVRAPVPAGMEAQATNVAVWDFSQLTTDHLPEPRMITQPSTGIWRLLMLRGGRWLFTSRGDATAQLYDLSQPEGTPIRLDTPGVQGAAVSPDGRWLAMCKRGPSVRFFDMHAKQPENGRRTLFFRDDVLWNVAISGDSRWLVTASGDGTIRRLCLDIDWCLDYVKRMTRRDLRPEERQWYGIDSPTLPASH